VRTGLTQQTGSATQTSQTPRALQQHLESISS